MSFSLRKVDQPCWDNSLSDVSNFLKENTMATNPGWVLDDFQRIYINTRIDMRTGMMLIWTEELDNTRQYYCLYTK